MGIKYFGKVKTIYSKEKMRVFENGRKIDTLGADEIIRLALYTSDLMQRILKKNEVKNKTTFIKNYLRDK